MIDRHSSQVLLEHELFDIFDELGLPVPRHRFFSLAAAKTSPLELGDLEGQRGVLKVVSPRILHKSDVGGVAFLERVTEESVRDAALAILDGLPGELRSSVRGLVLEEAVPFEPGLGRELLLGLRRSDAFGAVVTVGFGGTHVEAMAAATHGESTILLEPGVAPETRSVKLARALFFRWATGRVRGVPGAGTPGVLELELTRWIDGLSRVRARVEQQHGRTVEELEVNPLVWDQRRQTFTPVDALMRLGPDVAAATPPPFRFPVESLRRALRPERVAIMGASTKGQNVGRIILGCLLEGGFPAENVVAIHPKAEAIDGVRCIAELADLADPVDLLVLAVAAHTVPDIVEQVLEAGVVRGAVLLIPGGMGETEEGKGIERELQDLLARGDIGRSAPARGVASLLPSARGDAERPALIGNNSLGFVSRPAAFDTLFIPRDKLPRVEGGLENVALISQSGAFMITAMTKLDFLSPAFQISLGNQIDARVSHFVEALADEPDLTTYGLYVEGLRPGDGERLTALVRRLVQAGRDVVVFKGGRSALGQQATMGHTASVAGDYRVFADLLADAGALVARSFSDWRDLVRLSATLNGRPVGRRVGLMSNAGYEAVGLADNHGDLRPARLAEATLERLRGILEQAGLASLVSAKNPLDVTPMARDAVHIECMRAILDDPGVDVAVFGNVPLTAMVQSLPHGVSDHDVFDASDGYANLTIGLYRSVEKPFVVVIDGGRLYDAMADHIQRAGVPVFRSGDRAARLLSVYVESRLAHRR
jgi:acyl-CoA synthetase (NDP forming)